ncbi:PAS domain-containing sensor histidine kinase [Pontibacter sp. SGAir0037]|uniref:PAS domain-containing sensor histidine kinase n=1 Tax=Pontibacter sp. SGAir0037 TaxID=2571030 RepID=UPI0010CCFB94|nr:PAS domain-containing sensor histidine kinase [Pontibacter sp. SGAir0037]QCR22866.1 PAS domain-containing sensor histidine kinase [Pontibacter sp. SGAir0037]
MDINNNFEIFEKLINQAEKVLFSFDTAANSVSYLNHAFELIWKQSRERFVSNPANILETVHPDDRDYLVKKYREVLKGKSRENLEFRIVHPDNALRWLQLTPQRVTDKHGREYVVGLIDDVTIMRENISTMQKFGAKKNSILEILSHDLAGPLANIKVLSEVLSESTREYNNPEVNEIISIIRESSDRNIHLIRNFVQQEFLESVDAGLVKKRIDLVAKVQEVMEQYKDGQNLIHKEIRFSSSSDKIYVNIDQTKFMQVINNLMSNAIKFTEDNGIIAVDLSEKESTVLIKVQDNGIGIPRKYHDELFEKFTRARREGLKGEPSTGLGMSIIKTIVEWHDGSIWFESEEKAGTTFYIELPKDA